MDRDRAAYCHLPYLITKFEQPILLLIHRPAITPRFHLLPTFGASDVDRGNDPVDSQSTAKHGQLSEAAVFTVRHAKTARSAGASALGNELFHGEGTLPVGRMQHGLDGGRLGEATVWWPVVPA
jgi:hypothetical protein